MIETKRIVMTCAKEIVEERYGVRISATSKSRSADVSDARGVFAAILKGLYGFRYTDLAKYLGLTACGIAYSEERVQQKSKTDPITKREIAIITKLVEAKVKELLSER